MSMVMSKISANGAVKKYAYLGNPDPKNPVKQFDNNKYFFATFDTELI